MASLQAHFHDTFREMECERPVQKPDKPVSGRVPLNQIAYGSAKFYVISDIKWTVQIGNSPTHNFNHICISTDELEEKHLCRVNLEVCAPKLFRGRRTFWHVFEMQRNTFCIPFPDVVQQENRPSERGKPKATEGTLQKKKGCGPYIRFLVYPIKTYYPSFDTWRVRNFEFPFADVKLRVGSREICVNKKILSATSRFYMSIIGGSRVKMIQNWQTLYVNDVEYEDLYDLIGYIYHNWQFDYRKSFHLQQVAEQFGVMMHANNAEDFEGRTSMEYLSRRCYDGMTRETRFYWQEAQCSSDRESTVTSVFEKSENGEEGDDENANDAQGNDIEMRELPVNSPMSASAGSSISGTISPNSEPMAPQWDDDTEPSDIFETAFNEEMQSVSSLQMSPPRYRAPPLPEFYSINGRLPPNDPHLIQTMRGSLSFTLNLFETPNRLRGYKKALITALGRWDVYIYRRTVNDQEFLALGIYVNELSPVCNCDTEIRVKVNSLNMKSFRKIITKMFSSRQNTLGYPNFIPWGDALNWAVDGMLKVTLSVVMKVTDAPMPPMHFDMFPGQKDVLVRVEDTTCPVSKDVLSDVSPVFKEIFDSAFILMRSRVYDIPEFSYYHFIQTLDIIYNRLTRIPAEDVEPLMVLAVKFKIQFVIDQLGREYVDKCVFSDKDIYQFARKYNSKKAIYAHCNHQEFYNINRAEPLLD